MPQMFFYGFIALATAVLNAHRRFAAAAFAPVLNNVVVIASSSRFPASSTGRSRSSSVRGDTALLARCSVLAPTAGIAAIALVLVPAIMRSGARRPLPPALRLARTAPSTRWCGCRAGRSATSIANQIALWVVLVLANGNDGGAVRCTSSAYAFFQLPHGLLAVSLMTTIAPEMASAAARGDIAGLRERACRSGCA